MVDSTTLSLRHFSKSDVLVVCTLMNVCTGGFCYFLFVVSVDDENSKDVLAINEVRLSAHKGEHPDDSEDYAAIGLSSEEEAEDLPDSQYIRRKFQIPPPLPPDPVPSVPSALMEMQVEIQLQSRFQLVCSSKCMKH